ncbi:MAG: AzlD domain-containing protein [Butyrivibrio sp.]|uniref:branched-chain amino acid transporter permease n=1 Tax=Butyrivibrio sp. TaxID=28121 RepID=UPI0025D1626C|nr:AzlD domain-containing protein [Butyrivibrio sp.]MCR5769713.1 AzlD domain-containing protein [Butyrivibrio sp.]
MNTAILIIIMSLTTIIIRALPFLVFRKKTPLYIQYLGKVLPQAIIGMLVIYCLKDVSLSVHPFGLPELIASGLVVIVQILSRNSLFSILSGTVAYMLLVQLVF